MTYTLSCGQTLAHTLSINEPKAGRSINQKGIIHQKQRKYKRRTIKLKCPLQCQIIIIKKYADIFE